MKKLTVLAAMAAALISTGAGAATNLVVNGDFTTLSNGLGLIGSGGNTTASPWTTTGYNLVLNNGTNSVHSVALWDASNGGANTWNGLAPNGSSQNFLAMDGDYGTSPVMQTISGLTVGKTYTLSFNYAFAQQQGYTGATQQDISASFGGSTVYTSALYSLPSTGFSGWSTETLNLTATNTSEVLSFLAYGDKPVPPFALLTGVSLTAAVPEPATWGMMIVGLGAMGAAARMRRRRALAAA